MINIDDRIIDNILPEIKPNAFAVLMVIVRHLNKKNKCWPSRKKMQEKTGLSKNTVDKALKLLFDKKIIKKKERKGTSNIYTINIDGVSIFIPVNGGTLKEDNPTQKRDTPLPKKGTRSIK